MLKPDLSKIYLFRITHIENIPHILQYGITHSNSSNSNPNYVPIGDTSIISKRSEIILKNGICLSDYTPFYFGRKMPMLFVVQKGYNKVKPISAENIVYYISSVQKIIDSKLEFVFTDGHAVNKLSKIFTDDDIQNINSIIDMTSINEKYWGDKNNLDKKRKKEAEFLVRGDVPLNAILGFITYNKNAYNKLINFGVNQNKVRIKQSYYF